MQEMNYKVTVKNEDPYKVAKQYLEKKDWHIKFVKAHRYILSMSFLTQKYKSIIYGTILINK